MSIFEHPGFMEYETGAIEVLHADWPVYPTGHGWELALKSLAIFSSSVRFREIDDIDKCLLFVAVGSGSCLEPKGNLCDSKWFHVAVWHDDLLKLHKRGFVSGVSLLTAYEAASRKYEQFKDSLVMDAGQPRPLGLPRPQRVDYDEDLPEIPNIVPEGIAVTKEGMEALITLAPPLGELEKAVRQRAEPLLSIRFYDSAIREAGIILETKLREITGSGSFGQALIDEYYKVLCSRNAGKPSACRAGVLEASGIEISSDPSNHTRSCRRLSARTSSGISAQTSSHPTEPE